jgi:hypothetical protein
VVKHLLLDLAKLECRLASLALASGNAQLTSELLTRASWLLRLRNASQARVEKALSRGHDPF